MVEVTQEDANNYCLILKALGMEEEGDPVAAIVRFQHEIHNLRALARSCAPELEVYNERLSEGHDIGDAECAFAAVARLAITAILEAPNAELKG